MKAKKPSPQIMLNQGLVLSALARHEEALASFDAAIKLKSKFADAHVNRAAVLAVLGRDEEGLESCRKAIALTPNNAEAHYNLGNSLRRLGRNEEALKSFERALALRPDYVNALNNRGMTLAALQPLRRGARRLRARAELCGRSIPTRSTISAARCARSSGSTKRSRRSTSRWRSRRTTPRCITIAAMRSRRSAGSTMRRQPTRRRFRLRPNLAEAFNNRGSVLHELARYEEALESFDRALALREGLCRGGQQSRQYPARARPSR